MARTTEQRRAYNKAYYAANKDKENKRSQARYSSKGRNELLLKKYGIGIEQYDAMLAAQGGRCATCSSPDPKTRWGVFVVDHCHASGAVRELLCFNCNSGLGQFFDNPDALRAAASYVEKHRQ